MTRESAPYTANPLSVEDALDSLSKEVETYLGRAARNEVSTNYTGPDGPLPHPIADAVSALVDAKLKLSFDQTNEALKRSFKEADAVVNAIFKAKYSAVSKPRFANPRDTNERQLLELAERLGAHWCESGPLDGWCFVRGRWVPVEIKKPEREGLVFEYTPAQRRFLTWCRTRGATWWVWRTEADVLRDLGGRVAA